MNGNGPLDPVATTERLIRKSQRAIGITLKIDYSIGMGGETAKRALIMEHTEKIIELKLSAKEKKQFNNSVNAVRKLTNSALKLI